jgi:hypothetical protein
MPALYDRIGDGDAGLRRADPRLRSGSSLFRALADAGRGLERLRKDLANGAWDRRQGALRESDSYDAGYRLIEAA